MENLQVELRMFYLDSTRCHKKNQGRCGDGKYRFKVDPTAPTEDMKLVSGRQTRVQKVDGWMFLFRKEHIWKNLSTMWYYRRGGQG